MLKPAQRMKQFLPKSLRQPADQLQILFSTGMLADPMLLAKQWQQRKPFMKVQKALLYHRFATGLLLGHEIGLYGVLDGVSLSPAEAAKKCKIHPRAADQLLRILESEGLLNRKGGKYTLNTFGRMYLSPASENTLAPMLDLMAAQAAAFKELPLGMATGKVPSSLDIFSPDGRYKAFLGAVNEFLSWAVKDLFFQIELPEVKDFIVGSMGVSFSACLLEAQPGARVTYGCLDHLVKEIPRLRKQYKVPAGRVTGMHAHGGDPADDKWGDESYDLVFLTKKMILEPDQKMGEKFATKAFEVLRPGGMTIFWETIHPDNARTPLAVAMEAVMDLGASPIGIVSTRKSITAMLKKIGYAKVEIVTCLGGQTTFVVARKN